MKSNNLKSERDYFLIVDTSSYSCKIALSDHDKIICEAVAKSEISHTEHINILIQNILDKPKISMSQLKAVAINRGPGSFTGLRIGISTIQAIAYGLDLPIIGFSKLSSMAFNFYLSKQKIGYKDFIMASSIGANKNEIFIQFFNENFEELGEIEAVKPNDDFIEKLLNYNKEVFIIAEDIDLLDSLQKHKLINILKTEIEISDYLPMIKKLYNNKSFIEVSQLSPTYVKQPYITQKRKIFNFN